MTIQPSMGSAGSTYPGEYTPDLANFERLKTDDSVKGSPGIFSQVNISEDNVYYKIELQTPGLTRKDLLVRINERGNLFLAGIPRKEKPIANTDFTKPNRDYSAFSRELSLPSNIDTYFIKAEFRLGILSIWFLKTTDPYPKRPSFVVVY